MVTAELAVALPALAVVLVGAVGVLSAVSVQARCVDAAGVAARAAARGDPAATVAATVSSLLTGARVGISTSGSTVTATVTSGLPELPDGFGGLTVSGTATALVETP